MTDKQNTKGAAQSQQDKAFFVLGVIEIIDKLGTLIEKTALASSKLTPCFFRLAAAIRSSHSKRSVLMFVV